ncbi:MAG TPA: efflux transporter outer membrane subunit [Xanthobacteraceae bacterium]|nr:efflux transporter outer membrane subunit [Xanthobacteraceae bacterium]
MATILSGCAVGPDFVPPHPPQASGYSAMPPSSRTVAAKDSAGTSQHFVMGRDLPGDWWRVFGYAPLGSLVERALNSNPDLRAAQAALRMAEANTAAAQGGFFPQADGSFAASRQKTGLGSTSGLATDTPTYNLFTGQVQVSYTPDVFGGTRRLVESLQAQANIERFQLEATYLALTAHIVLTSVQEASLRGQIAATHKLIKIAADLLHGLRAQFAAGAISEADIVTQEATLAQIEQSLPPLEQQLAEQRHLLSALTGGLPSEGLPETFELRDFHLPHDLPLSVPSQLVEQRPDIRAAEAKMQSTSALIGVAVANRLPNISLTANYGVNALSPDQVFAPGSNVWGIGGAALMPILHGGTLFEREVTAREAFDQASSQYRSAVIAAFQNVADCLSALQNDAKALQKAVAFEGAAAKTLAIMRQRLEIGDVNYIELLNAQLTYQRALITLVIARRNRFADTAALFQALGGGWWNRSDVESPKRRPFLSFITDPIY